MSTSINPLQTNSVLMLAVLRSADKTVVAVFYSVGSAVTKEGVRECIAVNVGIQPGKRYSSQGDSQAIHYMMDAQGRVYAVVTNPSYPMRAAFQCLDELQDQFKDLGPKVSSATEESLSASARMMMKSLVERFNDPNKVDKLQSLSQKIDVVQTVMKENIQQILANEEKIERIEAASDALNEQAIAFQSSSKQLTTKMWWKMWKMRILFGGLVIVILIVIIVPSVIASQRNQQQQQQQ